MIQLIADDSNEITHEGAVGGSNSWEGSWEGGGLDSV